MKGTRSPAHAPLKLSRLSISLATLALFAGVFGTAEIALRVAAPAPKRPQPASGSDDFTRRAYGPYFRITGPQDARVYEQVAEGPFFPSKQVFPVEEPAGSSRIVFVGESSALHAGYYAARDEREGRLPGLRVVNLGISGGSLEMIRGAFRQAIGLRPRAIVIFVGNNVNYRFPNPGAPLQRIGRLALRSRVVAVLGARLAQAPPREVFRRRLAKFRRWLDDVALAAREARSPVLICTVPANLWFPPEVGTGELSTPLYFNAKFEAVSGRPGPARKLLAEALAGAPGRQPGGRFELARLAYEAGDYAEARSGFEAVRDAGFGATADVNRVIREAASRNGFDVLDLEKIVAQQAPHGVAGWESFSDHQHVTRETWNRELAELYPLLKARGVLARPGKPFIAPLRPPEENLEMHLREAASQAGSGDGARPSLMFWVRSLNARAYQETAEGLRPIEAYRKALAGRVFAEIKERDRPLASAILAALADGFWRAGRKGFAATLSAEAIALDQGEDAQLSRGWFLAGQKRLAEARASFHKALELNPQSDEARYALDRLASESAAAGAGVVE